MDQKWHQKCKGDIDALGGNLLCHEEGQLPHRKDVFVACLADTRALLTLSQRNLSHDDQPGGGHHGAAVAAILLFGESA